MSVQPLETEIEIETGIEIVFECTVCFITDAKFPTKYNCSNCTKKICNDCFARHIRTKINCVFCRSPLILKKENIVVIQSPPHPAYSFLCVRYKTITYGAIGIFTVWYMVLFIYMLRPSSGAPSPCGEDHNQTDTH